MVARHNVNIMQMPPLQNHPQRLALHNEIHARPPEAMQAPLAVSHVVMVCNVQEREASRAHLASLLHDHHLPAPDAQLTHVRLDFGSFRLRWEMHTEFVAWTFSRTVQADGFGTQEPPTALQEVPQTWLAGLPGQCLASLHLWLMPTHSFANQSLVKHVLRE